MKKVLCYFIISAAVILQGCGPARDMSGIHIAVMGSAEVYGLDRSFLNGIKMAVDECNQLYGGEFMTEYTFFDDNYDFELGVINANLIAKDPKYTAVIGPHSFAVSETAAPLFEDCGKIFIAANGMMDRSIAEKRYKYVFRNTTGESDMAKVLAAYAKERGLKSIAVCYSETEFEMNMIKRFVREVEGMDIPVLSYVTEVGTERSFKKVADTWNALGIDGVFICRDAIEDAFVLAKLVRPAMPQISILGDFSFDAADKLKEYEEYTQGIVIPTLVPLADFEARLDFEKRYFDKYREVPTWWAAHGYDSVRIVADAAANAGSNKPGDIAEIMHGEYGFDGLAGKTVFDEDGALVVENQQYMEVSGTNFVFKSIDGIK